MDIAHDLTLLYAGWPAQAVTWLPLAGIGDTRRAIFNAPGAAVLDDGAVLTDASLQYPTAHFPGVRQGDRFVVGGATWAATAPAQPLQDGAESIVPIARAV